MNAGLGAFVRVRRAAVGLTAREVADAAGLTWQYITNLENGREVRFPAPDQLRNLARALGVTPHDLLVVSGYLDDDPAP